MFDPRIKTKVPGAGIDGRIVRDIHIPLCAVETEAVGDKAGHMRRAVEERSIVSAREQVSGSCTILFVERKPQYEIGWCWNTMVHYRHRLAARDRCKIASRGLPGPGGDLLDPDDIGHRIQHGDGDGCVGAGIRWGWLIESPGA